MQTEFYAEGEDWSVYVSDWRHDAAEAVVTAGGGYDYESAEMTPAELRAFAAGLLAAAAHLEAEAVNR
jgi:hypothetical protein